LILLTQLAQAQYSWIDDKNTRVFSDRPPPPGTPASRILKGPRPALPQSPAEGVPATPGAPPQAAAPAKPPTLAEQEAAFRQRQAKREEDARKAQQAADQKVARDERCAMARQEEMQMTSGIRVSQVDAKGERYFLSDAERAKRADVARRALQDCR
jgi:hypothetical protein